MIWKENTPGSGSFITRLMEDMPVGNNLGCRNATGEYILVLNHDTEAFENEICKMLDEARAHPEYSIISCRQENVKGKETPGTGEFHDSTI